MGGRGQGVTHPKGSFILWNIRRSVGWIALKLCRDYEPFLAQTSAKNRPSQVQLTEIWHHKWNNLGPIIQRSRLFQQCNLFPLTGMETFIIQVRIWPHLAFDIVSCAFDVTSVLQWSMFYSRVLGLLARELTFLPLPLLIIFLEMTLAGSRAVPFLLTSRVWTLLWSVRRISWLNFPLSIHPAD